ncbi:hypothetical protein OsccyDRAFT_1904 [Leptolyngbyaceae cyanobacterium JSC-12]|nr:hypothetical protein OsccyDRAFT_1904 [Leptolyngbyaceae cyanobacterium JSC-12]
MLPFVAVPSTIAQEFGKYRDLFCRGAGFEQVSRYVTGLLLSENKTLQGIAGQWVAGGEVGGRRAMHAAVFEAGWRSSELMSHHRAVIAKEHQGRGREVISLDWTLSHHDWGKQIFGVKRSYDYVEHRMSCFQTVVTATIANRHLIDGIDVVVQFPDFSVAEREYLKVTAKSHYDDLDQVRERLIEMLHYHKNRLEYRKRTEIAVEIVRQVEAEGQFPTADYAFDNGVLTVELTTMIESAGKHWVSEVESSRNILWNDQWQRVDAIGLELRIHHPESFRPIQVTCRNGETKPIWAFTKVVRLKKFGRKRLVIVHEQADLQDPPRFLLTDALHWESGRVMQTWSYRWSCEVFHEVSKQHTGLESAQVRNEEAVNRHFRLSCVAQSILQRTACSGAQSERFEFAQGKQTVGQKLYTLTRQAFDDLLQFIVTRCSHGHTNGQILQALLPS